MLVKLWGQEVVEHLAKSKNGVEAYLDPRDLILRLAGVGPLPPFLGSTFALPEEVTWPTAMLKMLILVILSTRAHFKYPQLISKGLNTVVAGKCLLKEARYEP